MSHNIVKVKSVSHSICFFECFEKTESTFFVFFQTFAVLISLLLNVNGYIRINIKPEIKDKAGTFPGGCRRLVVDGLKRYMKLTVQCMQEIYSLFSLSVSLEESELAAKEN